MTRMWQDLAVAKLEGMDEQIKLQANGTLKVTVTASDRDTHELGDAIMALLTLGGDQLKDIGLITERVGARDEKDVIELRVEDRKIAAHIANILRENNINFIGSNLSRRKPKP